MDTKDFREEIEKARPPTLRLFRVFLFLAKEIQRPFPYLAAGLFIGIIIVSTGNDHVGWCIFCGALISSFTLVRIIRR